MALSEFYRTAIKFILAHGRPTATAMQIVRTFENAFIDSAFMPIANMKRVIDDGMTHKMLWGTDMCIPQHFYPNEDMAEYYLRKLAEFKKICTREQLTEVCWKNAARVFNLDVSVFSDEG